MPIGSVVSQASQQSPSQLQLRAAGWTFALAGLAPAPPTSMPVPMAMIAHWYGFAHKLAAERMEAVTLALHDPAPTGPGLVSMVRAMAGLAARLAQLDHAEAVVWHPARSAMAPAAFATAIGNWLRGGAFPALGLTALFQDANGALRSEGLAFFTGQELLIEPHPSINTAANAKIAARLINELVGIEAINQRFELIGPNGENLSVAPSGDDRTLRVWRTS